MATKIRLDSQTQGKLPANSLYDGDENISGNKNFAGNTLYVDDANDRVGIGTTTPTRPLTVVGGDNNETMLLQNNNITSASVARIESNSITTGAVLIVDANNAGFSGNNAILFRNQNASSTGQVLRVINSGTGRIATFEGAGNVGIGTAAPRDGGKVDIVGGNLLIDGTSIQGGSGGETLEILRNALYDGGYKYINDGYSAGIWASQGAGYIGFKTAPSGLAGNAVTFTEHMRLTNNGNVGIGTSTPNNSAKLDITSTEQGFLPPRMTTAQRDAISSPAGGLVIYNTTTKVLNFYNGTTWGAV